MCTFFNTQMAEILLDNQIIHPFTSTNCSLRQKYIIKRPHKHVLCDIHSPGFNTSMTNTVPKVKHSQLTLVKFVVILLGERRYELLSHQVLKVVKSVNEMPLYVKSKNPILIKSQILAHNLKQFTVLYFAIVITNQILNTFQNIGTSY